VAAQQLTMRMVATQDASDGLLVLAHVLQQAALASSPAVEEENAEEKKDGTAVSGRDAGADDENHKLTFDAAVFCLNIFTNVVESGTSPQLLSEIQIHNAEEQRFLPWLVDWIVDQTTSFREALVESTFGSSPSKHSTRHLEEREDEKLVLAGNGFVLLTCLMLHGNSALPGETEVDTSREQEGNESVREMILFRLPGPDTGAKTIFVVNTLKAFCNFYHMTVGDLSVPVVAPVKKLMEQLESTIGQSS